ncbi:ABC transporter substrate-binding protein [Streptomyces albireticuli]|uniref:Peptide-binding protein n=1 Tax=Streptomyces albireticuli TaxID=1940 RepID=A0A2A2CZ62_9ACTN|nr:ABC transporter substrate-binding protein [Streptomyces albireticuli]MCD9143420.1 ABC transporter substrate-binding protein [Streptomyces albireticuli]MCD9164779.1 ABC transporter substrate-binding protein [Streptomyces albireticuli]MCD9191537.1 ABC transporter substrate-binding protein [Streptomyces albireticuli]PAU45473.1 peptide-binding protein [Streptomyces albireticuli]
MNRKTLVLPTLAVLLAPVLAACGGSDEAGKGGGAIVIGTTDRFEETTDAPAPFDPAAAYDIGAWNVLHSTFQTLLRLPRSGTSPVADAASTCTFGDRKNEQYRCTLRSGLKFSNGHALTSEDVKFSIDRARAINFENGPVSLLSNIDSVETPSELEVVFHLKSPDATFPQKIATPAAAIVDSETYGKKELGKGFKVVGSGPYTLQTEEKDGRVVKAVFSKNSDYQGSVQLQNDKVEMRFYDDAKSMEKALKDGDIDIMNRTLAPDQLSRMRGATDQGVRLLEAPGQEISFLAFNTDDPSVKNKAVRQAVAQLVDRQALARDGYDRTNDPLYSLVPSGITGHQNSFSNKYGEPSADKARSILRAANITSPVPLTLTYTDDHYGEATAKAFQALQKQLNGSGLFQAKIQGVKWADFRPEAAKGKYAVYGMGWFPDFPDPDNFVAPFFGKDNFLRSPYQNTRISSQLIPDSREAAQRDTAAKYFQQAQDIVADDVPVLPLWQGKQYVAVRSNVTGAEWALNSASEMQPWELGRGK